MSKTKHRSLFDFAVKMEQESETFYRNLASEAKVAAARRVFVSLAEDEVKHARTLARMQKEATAAMRQTTILEEAQRVFASMADRKAFEAAGPDQLDLFRQAQAMERKSCDFYRSQAKDARSKASREMLLRLAEEENRHLFLLETMAEFVSRPEVWLGKAEPAEDA